MSLTEMAAVAIKFFSLVLVWSCRRLLLLPTLPLPSSKFRCHHRYNSSSGLSVAANLLSTKCAVIQTLSFLS